MNVVLHFQALDGFIAVITQDGQLFYVSENVRDFLGYSQVSFIFYKLFSSLASFCRGSHFLCVYSGNPLKIIPHYCIVHPYCA